MNKKSYFTIILVLVMLIINLAVMIPAHTIPDNESHSSSEVLTKYVIRTPIVINNDTDFSGYGFIGNGTQSSPYLIEGYDINASGNGDAIYIGNTTKYFFIDGNYLHDAAYVSDYRAGAGVELYNVSHGTLYNNTFIGNGYGVFMENCSNLTILENKLDDTHYDVYIQNSNNSSVSYNIIESLQYGVYMTGANDSSLSDNTFVGNAYAVFIDKLHNDSFSYNIIENSTYYGIYVHTYADNNTFSYNKIENCSSYGVYVYYSSRNLFYNNSFYFNNGSNETYNSSHVQAYDSGGNWWNTTAPSGGHGYGNFWYDWQSPDNDSNGIVDNPYILDGGAEDYYPLVNSAPVPEFSQVGLMLLVLVFVGFIYSRRQKT